MYAFLFLKWHTRFKMDFPSLSVIIPVYNCKEYLTRCLSSVINQTFKDLEIIIVNDGSTDGSGEICEEFCAKDNRIMYINQENQGVAVARQYAIERARGKYITFVDSDDWIEPEMYAVLMNQIEDNQLITSGFYEDKGNGISLKYYDSIPYGKYLFEQMEYIKKNLIFMKNASGETFTTVLWNKIFDANILKKCCMNINLNIYYGEDSVLLYAYILNIESAVVTDNIFYHYTVRDSSVTHSIRNDYLENISNYYQAVLRIIKKTSYYNILKDQLERKVIGMFAKATGTRLGFSEKNSIHYFVYKSILGLAGKNVLLYGAGAVGKDYYYQFKKYNVTMVGWVDAGKSDGDDKPDIVTSIIPNESVFDVLIIALKSEITAKEITKDLINNNHIPAEKIIWEAPGTIV